MLVASTVVVLESIFALRFRWKQHRRNAVCAIPDNVPAEKQQDGDGRFAISYHLKRKHAAQVCKCSVDAIPPSDLDFLLMFAL